MRGEIKLKSFNESLLTKEANHHPTCNHRDRHCHSQVMVVAVPNERSTLVIRNTIEKLINFYSANAVIQQKRSREETQGKWTYERGRKRFAESDARNWKNQDKERSTVK